MTYLEVILSWLKKIILDFHWYYLSIMEAARELLKICGKKRKRKIIGYGNLVRLAIRLKVIHFVKALMAGI